MITYPRITMFNISNEFESNLHMTKNDFFLQEFWLESSKRSTNFVNTV